MEWMTEVWNLIFWVFFFPLLLPQSCRRTNGRSPMWCGSRAAGCLWGLCRSCVHVRIFAASTVSLPHYQMQHLPQSNSLTEWLCCAQPAWALAMNFWIKFWNFSWLFQYITNTLYTGKWNLSREAHDRDFFFLILT